MYLMLNTQTKGILKLNQTCTLDLKVGSLVRSVRFFILKTNLPYALLGLGSCIAFQLIIDCVKQVVVQNGRNLINFSSSEGSDLSLHINLENKVKEGIFESEMKNDKTKECSIVKGKKGNGSQVKKKEKVNKGEIDVVKNRTKENNVLKFSNISETDSDNGCPRYQIEVEDNSETKDFGENFELKEILECYEDVFAKDKYDVGTIRIEPQRKQSRRPGNQGFHLIEKYLDHSDLGSSARPSKSIWTTLVLEAVPNGIEKCLDHPGLRSNATPSTKQKKFLQEERRYNPILVLNETLPRLQRIPEIGTKKKV
ncbi:hypothetical protein TNIN_367601 [Trichonephila inaurata madagascariensis]|uniref:Uncharacterized protein n=1 Tax=Trichonephila inaurata madagascariensis TaxID=2747483 RepID=A0A8X7C3W2_9ARAC|nr:hypothetical protein TNIN_367601 [Trichonephila inaurata madagascariensis]